MPVPVTDFSQCLAWISTELGASLSETRNALERFVETPEQREPLGEVAAELQKVHGALRVVEAEGAVLLAEEMVHVAGALFEGTIKDSREGLEALSRAIVQLPAYVDRLQSGARDIPLVLLPLLNDLRAVRGSPLLSENTLFILKMDSERTAAGEPQPSGEDVVAVARKLRPHYQAALLGWLRGEHVDSNLATMGAVVGNIEQAAASVSLYQLFWIGNAIIEALLDDGLESSVAVKRLLGQADRHLKRLIDNGENSFDADPPRQLINNLLYYAARANSEGPKITAVRNAFNLAEILPGADQLQAARDHLAAPSAQLMQTVAAAIRQDLAHVKDVLDIYVRTGKSDLDDLAAQCDTLKRIADTLAMLGLGELRAGVLAERERFSAWIAGKHPVNDEEMLASAAVLLSLEDALESELVELINADLEPRAPSSDPDADDHTEQSQSMRESEFRAVVKAVLRECLVNLSRVKEGIGQFLESQTHSLDQVPALLRAINAGLLMLGKSRAVGLIDRIADYARAHLHGHEPGEIGQPELDRLADAIVSVECYLETLRDGRADPWYMLDNAAANLDVIAPRVPTEQLPMPQAPPLTPATGATQQTAAGAWPDEQPVALSDPGTIDPELLETFIEETREEIASLAHNWPAWRRQADDEHLTLVRRSFHTLKGSGRMVGAGLIGELCWALENLVNKHLNGTMLLDAAAVEVVDEAVAVLPQLLEQLEVGTAPRADIDALIARAEASATGERATLPAAEASRARGMDPVLYEIFCNETRTHLARIESYLNAAEARGSAPPLSEELHRAWHTLSGSAGMAGAQGIARIADPVQRFVRVALDDGAQLDTEALEVLTVAADWIRTTVAALNQGVAPEPDDALLARIDGLALDAESLVEGNDTAEIAGPAEPAVEPPQASEEQAEIVAVYGDEAAELLDAAEAALQGLQRDVADRSAFAALLRHLHTLKGGARMAGVAPIGDLSHELESLLQTIDGSTRSADAAVLGLMQESIDRMHGMADALRAGGNVTAADDLIERLRQCAGPEPVPYADIDRIAPAGPDEAPEPVASAAPEEPAAQPGDEQAEVVEPAAAEPEQPAAAEQEQRPDAVTASGNAVRADGEEQRPADEVQAPAVPLQVATGATAAPELFREEIGERQEFARVSADVLDGMLNNVGEVTIYHSRLEQQVNTIGFNTAELARTVVRLREQLRRLEMETETQILNRHQAVPDKRPDFDPLEMDRYSTIQQLSRALAESVSDLSSIQGLLEELTRDAETLLAQQSRVTTELQDGLMRTRMVPFERHVPRFSRLVRQTAAEAGKRAELLVEGGGELDRQVLDRMLAPFEHLLRNAVVHGIETPEIRERRGKPATGTIRIALSREGSEMVIALRDDGAGLDLAAIRSKAQAQGLVAPDANLTESEVLQLILEPGFTTAAVVTQSAGRGVGMDVVANVVKQLGGSLSIQSVAGRGAAFTVRLPLTLAITQALLIRTGEEIYAIPVLSLAGVARVPTAELHEHLQAGDPQFSYGETDYRLRHVGHLLGTHGTDLDAVGSSVALVLVKAGEHSTALIADEIVGSREIVVKPVGPQIAAVRGVAGATILGDGSIVVILDVNALVRGAPPAVLRPDAIAQRRDERPSVLVVDDSITVRRVTQRLLERHEMRVVTAKDGVDAVSAMQEFVPDLILLDIEMPRMDGYEVATHVRNSPRLQQVPIVMITSRVGDKHRNRAIELGVNAYLGKPYQEASLLETIRPLLARHQPEAARS